jgi:hypothetical protein
MIVYSDDEGGGTWHCAWGLVLWTGTHEAEARG